MPERRCAWSGLRNSISFVEAISGAIQTCHDGDAQQRTFMLSGFVQLALRFLNCSTTSSHSAGDKVRRSRIYGVVVDTEPRLPGFTCRLFQSSNCSSSEMRIRAFTLKWHPMWGTANATIVKNAAK